MRIAGPFGNSPALCRLDEIRVGTIERDDHTKAGRVVAVVVAPIHLRFLADIDVLVVGVKAPADNPVATSPVLFSLTLERLQLYILSHVAEKVKQRQRPIFLPRAFRERVVIYLYVLAPIELALPRDPVGSFLPKPRELLGILSTVVEP